MNTLALFQFRFVSSGAIEINFIAVCGGI